MTLRAWTARRGLWTGRPDRWIGCGRRVASDDLRAIRGWTLGRVRRPAFVVSVEQVSGFVPSRGTSARSARWRRAPVAGRPSLGAPRRSYVRAASVRRHGRPFDAPADQDGPRLHPAASVARYESGRGAVAAGSRRRRTLTRRSYDTKAPGRDGAHRPRASRDGPGRGPGRRRPGCCRCRGGRACRRRSTTRRPAPRRRVRRCSWCTADVGDQERAEVSGLVGPSADRRRSRLLRRVRSAPHVATHVRLLAGPV